MNKVVILVANRCFAIWNSRLELIKKLKEKGYRIIVIAAKDEYSSKLESVGVDIIYVEIKRGGFSLQNDLQLYKTIKKAYKEYLPTLVQLYNAKPVMIGSYLAKYLPRQSIIISTITGLGYAFENSFFLQKIAGLAYRISLRYCNKVVFQNKDDKDLFVENKFVPLDKTESITGSGVDTEKFQFQEKNNNTIKIYFVGRLLWQKGIREFVEVAQQITPFCPNCSFHIVGELEPNHPNAVPSSFLQAQQNLGLICYHGYKNDMVSVYKDADILLFPSFYREGIPRVVLEASASGVIPVGFDVPGVRESIDDKKSGYLVPKHDVNALVDNLKKLINNKDLRKTMSKDGRDFIVKKFSIDKITEEYLQLYKKLGLEK
jgi:glycosyltransferase involved in cell wall biosynthesis